MPSLDLYHDAVKQALIKDGWVITHDPLHLRWGRKDMYVDLGAKRLIMATRAEEKIAVEVKNFIRASEMEAFRDAIGQYAIYVRLCVAPIQIIPFTWLSTMSSSTPCLKSRSVN